MRRDIRRNRTAVLDRRKVGLAAPGMPKVFCRLNRTDGDNDMPFDKPVTADIKVVTVEAWLRGI